MVRLPQNPGSLTHPVVLDDDLDHIVGWRADVDGHQTACNCQSFRFLPAMAVDSQFKVSPRVAMCLGAAMNSSSSFVSVSTSTTSTAPLKSEPIGRFQLAQE